MKVAVLTLMMGLFMSINISPKKYVDMKYDLTDFKQQVDEVLLLQDVVYQQMVLSEHLQAAAMEGIQDTLAVYSTLSEIDAYQAALAVSHKRRRVIKQHKREFRGLSKKQRLARADSIINGSYTFRSRFVQSNLVISYESKKTVQGMRRSTASR